MKKRLIISIVLTVAIILAGVIPAFAAEPTTNQEADADVLNSSVIVPTMDFTGKTISLSLAGAAERMKSTGPGYDAAVLARDLTLAAAKGYAESWNYMQSVSRMIQQGNVRAANPAQSIDAKVIEITRPYLTNQATIGFDIALAQLEHDTIKSYYNVLLAQDNLRISQDNLRVQNEILENTNKKFELGVSAKMDVLLAESAMQDALTTVNENENTLKSARMGFNFQLNYPLMQNVAFTDSLVRARPLILNLKSAISDAFTNRNELNIVEYNLQKALLQRESVSAYPGDSSTVLNADLEIKKYQMQLESQRTSIEMDIRGRFMKLDSLNAAIFALDKTVSNAQEAYRLASLSYEAGMQTLVDVQSAQLNSYRAQLARAAQIAEYDLAVYELNYATGIGLTSAAQQQNPQ
jgi:hypothetical protein